MTPCLAPKVRSRAAEQDFGVMKGDMKYRSHPAMLAGVLCSVLLEALRLATVVQKDREKQEAGGARSPTP